MHVDLLKPCYDTAKDKLLISAKCDKQKFYYDCGTIYLPSIVPGEACDYLDINAGLLVSVCAKSLQDRTWFRWMDVYSAVTDGSCLPKDRILLHLSSNNMSQRNSQK